MTIVEYLIQTTCRQADVIYSKRYSDIYLTGIRRTSRYFRQDSRMFQPRFEPNPSRIQTGLPKHEPAV
jgi:hypothetical protein